MLTSDLTRWPGTVDKYHMTRVLGLITARGGSKGVPRKNLCPVGGRLLIDWTIDAALKAGRLDRVVVSTDDPEIAQAARNAGGDTPFLRPAELARDETPHIDVVLHALDWLSERGDEYEYVVLLQPTSPLRTAADIDDAVDLAVRRDADAVVSVVETHDHPYLTRRMTEDGTLAEFVHCDIAYPRRQDLPAAYALNGAVFVNRRETLMGSGSFCPPGALAYVMPPERSLQIDTLWDLRLVGLVLDDRWCMADASE